MITKAFAEHFAKEWIESWNTHDLKKVFSRYTYNSFDVIAVYNQNHQ